MSNQVGTQIVGFLTHRLVCILSLFIFQRDSDHDLLGDLCDTNDDEYVCCPFSE